jgi:diacylglycerol kinase (ATP)
MALSRRRLQESVADMIASGRTRQVSVGQAGRRYFLLMAGVGMDAAVVPAVNPPLKRLTGQGAFWIAWIQHLIRWQPQVFVVDVNGQRHTATFAVLANAAAYGGGLRIAPHASLDSACLDLCLFAWTDRHRFVRHLRASRGGGHLGLPGVSYPQARRATMSAPGSVWVQTDGELLGELPMAFECPAGAVVGHRAHVVEPPRGKERPLPSVTKRPSRRPPKAHVRLLPVLRGFARP